jgi:L-iditol 2-dehydrogenase
VKAAKLIAPNELVIQDIDSPQAEVDDMLVRMRAATICGTDIRIFRGRKTAGVRYPSVLGHEFAGEVIEAAGHPGFAPGDRVSLCPAISCGRCDRCKRGIENLCTEGENMGYEIDGAFAEIVRVPARAVHAGNVRHLPDHLGYEHAALLEPLACVINGQNKVALREVDTVVVLGAGPIGLLQVALARLKGAVRIMVSDPNGPRREAALSLGADVAFDPTTENVADRVREETDGRGADVVICAIGVPALARQTTDLAAHGGRVSLFAGFSGGQTAEMDVNAIHYNEITVTGAFGLSRATYDQAFDMVSSGRLNLGPFVTHRFPLSQAIAAFEMAEAGEAIKVALLNE